MLLLFYSLQILARFPTCHHHWPSEFLPFCIFVFTPTFMTVACQPACLHMPLPATFVAFPLPGLPVRLRAGGGPVVAWVRWPGERRRKDGACSRPDQTRTQLLSSQAHSFSAPLPHLFPIPPLPACLTHDPVPPSWAAFLYPTHYK